MPVQQESKLAKKPLDGRPLAFRAGLRHVRRAAFIIPGVLTILADKSALGYLVIPPRNLYGFTKYQCFGNSAMGPGQHPGDRWPGNIHLLGHIFLIEAKKIRQTKSLQFINTNDDLF